jgi:hypothetical protein
MLFNFVLFVLLFAAWQIFPAGDLLGIRHSMKDFNTTKNDRWPSIRELSRNFVKAGRMG